MTSPATPLPTVEPASVRHAELWRVRVPLVRPHVAAHGTESAREVVLVALHGSDGLVGWGECDALSRPGYTSEWIEGAWLVLAAVLLPAWFARSSTATVGHPMAEAAVSGAALDLALQRTGTSLATAIGAERRAVPCGAVLSIAEDPGERSASSGALDALVASAAAALDAGAVQLKVKIHPGHDAEILGALRSTWPDAALAADANGSYREGDLDGLRALDALGLRYLEQPLPADDLVGSARVAARLETPVALDESVAGPGSLAAALELGAGSVVNVKPARLGGIDAARQTLGIAAARGADVFVGGMLELGVGRAAALAVAALPDATLPTDLGPSARVVTEDVTAPLVVDRSGSVIVPDDPGTGRAPIPARLSDAVVAHTRVDRPTER